MGIKTTIRHDSLVSHSLVEQALRLITVDTTQNILYAKRVVSTFVWEHEAGGVNAICLALSQIDGHEHRVAVAEIMQVMGGLHDDTALRERHWVLQWTLMSPCVHDRVAAANGLALMENTDSVPALYTAYYVEEEEEARVALENALQILSPVTTEGE